MREPSTIPAAESSQEAALEYLNECSLNANDPAYQAYRALVGKGPVTDSVLELLRGTDSQRARVALRALGESK